MVVLRKYSSYANPSPGKLGHCLTCGNSAGGYETLPDGRVVEPHTGLPADLNKGAGVGGTDNTPVPGVHGHHH